MPFHSKSSITKFISLILAGLLHTQFLAQNPLTHTNILRSNLDQFIFFNKLKALLQAKHSVRSKFQRIIGTGGTGIGYMFLLQMFTTMSSDFGLTPTTMPS